MLNTLILKYSKNDLMLVTNQYSDSKKRFIKLGDYNLKSKSFPTSDLFPQKWKNLQNHRIRVTLTEYLPSASFQYVDEGQGNINLINSNKSKSLKASGTEVDILLEFQRKFKCSIYASTVTWENCSAEEYNNLLIISDPDLVVGGNIQTYMLFKKFGFSVAIKKTSVHGLAPRPRYCSRMTILLSKFPYYIAD